MGQIFVATPNAYYEWHQIFKVADTYVLSIEVGIEKGKRWRPVLAVSQQPERGWVQLDVDTVLQTQWTGLYRDDTMYHVATPACTASNAPTSAKGTLQRISIACRME